MNDVNSRMNKNQNKDIRFYICLPSKILLGLCKPIRRTQNKNCNITYNQVYDNQQNFSIFYILELYFKSNLISINCTDSDEINSNTNFLISDLINNTIDLLNLPSSFTGINHKTALTNQIMKLYHGIT